MVTIMLCVETALQKMYVGTDNKAGNAATVYVFQI
jgi:hypothetical protein